MRKNQVKQLIQDVGNKGYILYKVYEEMLKEYKINPTLSNIAKLLGWKKKKVTDIFLKLVNNDYLLIIHSENSIRIFLGKRTVYNYSRMKMIDTVITKDNKYTIQDNIQIEIYSDKEV